jgi:uncharacterized membrane protein YhaH (DUF805 family)
LTGTARRRALWISGLVSLALFVVLATIDGRLGEDGATGIVPLELAGSTERAQEILTDWGPDRLDDARASLLVDYPYLIAYGVFLALACAAVADMNAPRPRLRAAGTPAAWAAVAAAVFDALEDAALLVVVESGPEQPWPRIAFVFAVLKFACAISATVYVLTGLVARAVAGGASRGSRAA